MTAERLSALDGSFLRLESATEHMHVGWRGTFSVPAGGTRPQLSSLRATVASRLRFAPRCRQRLAFPPAALGEPYWVDDEDFDLDFHVRRLGDPYQPPTVARFAALADEVLAQPLDRRRPLWELYLVPHLHGGGVGLVMKMHHAMVDGLSAVALALLVFSDSPDAASPAPEEWRPRSAPRSPALALRAIGDNAGDSLRVARTLAGAATSPVSGSGRLADTLRRTALAVGDDVLRPAPSSYVNRPIGAARTLRGFRLPLERLLEIKHHAGVTHNDVCLAIVAGAMRAVAGREDDSSVVLKTMVPVNTRDERAQRALGNRISFGFVDLPLGRASPTVWLRSVYEQTQQLKRSRRTAGTETLLSALRFAPSPLKTYAARLAGSARLYNLTVSNVPGPRTPVYMLGAQLREAYPVVPLSEEHALSIGVFTYCGGVHFGCYADPDAFPEVDALPAAMQDAANALASATRPRAPVARQPARKASNPRAARRGRGVAREDSTVASVGAPGKGGPPEAD